MRRKGSIQRLELLVEVQGSLQAFGDGVVGRLEKRKLAPAGESGFSYRGLFEHLGQELGSLRQGLVAAEDAHDRKVIRYAKVRKTSQELTSQVYRKQSRLRQTLEGLYGDDQGYELAVFSGRTPRYGTSLLEQVDQTVKFLGEPEGEVPVIDFDGIEVDLNVLARGLKSDRKQLEKAIARRVTARKKVNETKVRREEAIAEYDASFPWLAQTLESLFRLAGEHELARRIRTSQRAARAVAQTAETASEESSAGDSAAEETAPPTPESTDSDSASL